MKITAFILLIACLQVSANSDAQTVTISVNKAPLKKVFQQIQKQTGFSFLLDARLLRQTQPVSFSIKDVPIQKALDLCFEGQPLTYAIIENTIVIKEKATATALPASLAQPPLDISGRVTDADGNPLVGANVKVKGTTIGTATNTNGEFKLTGITENAVLEISFVGFETYSVAVNNKTSIVASLKVKAESLNEIVINKGYYTEKQRLSVSNVGRITAKDIEKQPIQNPLLALQGRVPGLTITQNSGVAGGGVTVRLQGQNSISALNGNDPLIIIDGVPYPSQMLVTSVGGYVGGFPILSNSGGPAGSGGGSPLSYINPLDIESIEVLKDADATAIYGSRAGSGAILITTKKGKVGQTTVNINVQQGWGKVAHFQKLMNTAQYLEMRKEAYANDGIPLPTVPAYNNYDLTLWDQNKSTDWQKVLIGRTAKYNNYSASVSGGTGASNYLFGTTYHKETTVYPGDFYDEKGSVHFNISNNSSDKKFVFQLTGNYLVDNNHLPAVDLTENARTLAPNAPDIFNSEGRLNWGVDGNGVSTWSNPFATVLFAPFKNKVKNLLGNATVGYRFTKDIELSSNFGYSDFRNTEYAGLQLGVNPPENLLGATRRASYDFSNINTWIIEPQFSYKISKGQNRFNFLTGLTFQSKNSDGQEFVGEGYNSDQVMTDIKAAPVLNVLNSLEAVYKYNAIFTRLNYTLKDKYILNITARRDGSSRFGVKNRFHNFGSLGAGWIFSDESLFKRYLNICSFGKLRGSFGTTGNDQIPDYYYMLLYSVINPNIPYQGTTGLSPNVLPNPYLQWEETKKLQVGIDLGFFNNKLSLSANYISNRSSNQLLSYSLPSITGFTQITDNFPALVENKGWEFNLTSTNVNRNSFKWTTLFNITMMRNKLISFPNISSSTFASGNDGVILGQPLGVLKIFNSLGVDPNTGYYQVADSSGKPTSNPDWDKDRYKYYNPFPAFYGGLQNNIEFKGFQLDFFIQFVKQDAANFLWTFIPGRFSSGNANQPADLMNRWQKPGDNAAYQKFSQDFSTDQYRDITEGSNKVYSDASFVRLKNVSLSYGFDKRWLEKTKIKDLKLFVQGQNLMTITKYKGTDPESRNTSLLPPLRVITVGINASL